MSVHGGSTFFCLLGGFARGSAYWRGHPSRGSPFRCLCLGGLCPRFLSPEEVSVQRGVSVEKGVIYVVVTGCPPFSPPWLLSDSRQAHYGSWLPILQLSTICIHHVNGGPQGCHWLQPNNSGWHLHGHPHMHTPLKFAIKEMHATSQGSLFG